MYWSRVIIRAQEKKVRRLVAEDKKHIVVVGGGYVGTMAAIIASFRPDLHVTLVEKQNRLCGLYNSSWSKGDFHFDFGSRAILPTGVKKLDELVLSLLPESDYSRTTENLKEFSFQKGVMCEYSSCLDARTLPEAELAAGREELLSIPEDTPLGAAAYDNLQDMADSVYGKVFSEKLIAPAMKKLTGLGLCELDPLALFTFSLQRIIIADQSESKELKALSDFNNARIAYAVFDDNKSQMIKAYPRRLGFGDFAERLQTYLESQPNVDLKFDTSIEALDGRDGNVDIAVLEGGEKLECDELLWTVPPVFLARLLELDLSGLKKPSQRSLMLFHFIFSGDLYSKAFYSYNYDPAFKSFRSTFYSNFCERPEGLQSATVEVIVDESPDDFDGLAQEVFSELKSSGMISKNSEIIDFDAQFHGGVWRSLKRGSLDGIKDVNERCYSTFENLHILGRASGGLFAGPLVQEAHALLGTISESQN